MNTLVGISERSTANTALLTKGTTLVYIVPTVNKFLLALILVLYTERMEATAVIKSRFSPFRVNVRVISLLRTQLHSIKL